MCKWKRMKAVYSSVLGTCEYIVGRRLKVPRSALIDHSVKRVREGGVLSIKLAQSIANRKSLIDDELLLRSLTDMQCLTTYDADGMATHEASIATVTQTVEGLAVKELRDDSILGDLRDLRRVHGLLVNMKAPSVVSETLHTLITEIDMSTEHAKYVSLSESLRNCSVITVPVVYSSTPTKVVMDYLPSILVKDQASNVPLDTVNQFFSQMVLAAFRTGTFHLDLHAGNVGHIDGQRFVVYDMGSVQTIDKRDMRVLLEVCVTASEHAFFDDWDAVAEVLVRGGFLSKVDDPTHLRYIVDTLFRYARNDIDIQDVVTAFKVIRGGIVADATVSKMMQSVALLEGTCKLMNPEFVPYNSVSVMDVLATRWG